MLLEPTRHDRIIHYCVFYFLACIYKICIETGADEFAFRCIAHLFANCLPVPNRLRVQPVDDQNLEPKVNGDEEQRPPERFDDSLSGGKKLNSGVNAIRCCYENFLDVIFEGDLAPVVLASQNCKESARWSVMGIKSLKHWK
jgi:hypothetical protein